MTYIYTKKKNKYYVIDKSVDKILTIFVEESIAKETCYNLNNGYGFGDFTPNFFYAKKEEA